MTAPLTPGRLHYIKGQQVQRKIARALRVSVNPDPLILELDEALAEVDRLRAQVAAVEALASGDEAGPCEHGRTACQCYGDEVQP